MKHFLLLISLFVCCCIYSSVQTYMYDEQLLIHKCFIVSYNNTLLIPNWVHYYITDDIVNKENLKRTNKFVADPLVKKSAKNTDYAKSGYDKGHLVPNADMNFNSYPLDECFYFSNICPQNPSLNRYTWYYLEQYVRELAIKYSLVEIYSGTLFYDSTYNYIGKNKVAVPDALFKVIIYNNDTLSYIFPNISINGKYDNYRAPIDSIEKYSLCPIRK